MISKSLHKICSEDISLIENYQEAVSSPELWVAHHRLEDLGFSKENLIYLGLYYGVPANELIFMTNSEHMSHHNKGDKNPFKKVSHLYRGENNPCYGKKWIEKDGKRLYVDESEINDYRSKGYTLGYTYSGPSRQGKNNSQYGKTDIESAYYWKYITRQEVPPKVWKTMESKWNWTPSCYPIVRDKNFKLTDF